MFHSSPMAVRLILRSVRWNPNAPTVSAGGNVAPLASAGAGAVRVDACSHTSASPQAEGRKDRQEIRDNQLDTLKGQPHIPRCSRRRCGEQCKKYPMFASVYNANLDSPTHGQFT
jgi:hypothetical protein